MWAIPTGTSSAFKKKNQVKSPSTWSRPPKPVRIHQSGRTRIRGVTRLILLVIVLLNFRFQKYQDPNPLLDPVGESKPEPDLLRHFQLSSQNILFGFINFSFSKVSRPESPTRPSWRIQAGARFTPTFSIIFSKHFVCVIPF